MSTRCSIGTPIPLSYRCADKTEFVLNVPRKPEFSGTPDILLLVRRGGGEWESKQQKKNFKFCECETHRKLRGREVHFFTLLF